MELRFVDAIENGKCRCEVKELYKKAFPLFERMPFFMLENAAKKGRATFSTVFDARKFAGFVYYVQKEDLLLIFFFAVNENLRGKGYGSGILSALKEKYSGKRIFLEIETIDERAKDNDNRLRRKAFYERNGFASCGFNTGGLFMKYDVLSFGGKVTSEDYRKLMLYFAGKNVYDLFYKNKGK